MEVDPQVGELPDAEVVREHAEHAGLQPALTVAVQVTDPGRFVPLHDLVRGALPDGFINPG